MMKIAAVDIGGTAMKAGLWTEGKWTQLQERETQASRGGVVLMERVKELLHTYHDFDAIGISTAGEVDTEKGSIFHANSNIPGYTGMPVREIMEREFQVPVAVENDVNAAALGELWSGAGRGCRDFLCLTYGTGVGGCIVINEKIYPGVSYSAGSFGGIVIHPEYKGGTDTLEGCYERCASTTALVKRVQKVDGTLHNGREIFAAIENEKVKEQVDCWIDDICTGLVTLTCIFNPSRIILGGGVMAQQYVLSEVNRKVQKQLSPNLRDVTIVPAQLGNTAGMRGAAKLAESLLL